MKKICTVFAFLPLLFTFQCFAQADERDWEAGRLTWDVFKGKTFSTSRNSSELSYYITYSTVKIKNGNSTFLVFQTRNYMRPDISWVNPIHKSEQLLRYNQVLFDILEVHRRKLQSSLHRLSNALLAEEKLQTHIAACRQETERFQNDTDFGMNVKALDYWEIRTAQELRNNPFERIPAYFEKNFGYGFYAGAGAGFLTTSLSNHFTHPVNILFGLNASYKKTMMFINATIGFNKVKNDYQQDGLLWPQNLRTGVAVIDFSIGHAIFNNRRHKFTPFAGLGVLQFSELKSKKDDDEDKKLIMANWGLIFGLHYDFKLANKIKLMRSPFEIGGMARTEHAVKMSLYATTGRFENMQGASINLGINYSYFKRNIGID